MHILFYDVATPLAYTNETLTKRALGGTEATIIRIAHALNHIHTISIAQHCRPTHENRMSNGVNYISLETANELSPDIVILLRKHEWIAPIGKQFPQARRFFWMHNIPPRYLFLQRENLLHYQYEIIAVSHFHKKTIEKRLNGKWYHYFAKKKLKSNQPIPIHVMYNPIDDFLNPNDTLYDPNQLFFMSSPHKGLIETLDLFKKVNAIFPNYHLIITNPGNWDDRIKLPKNTTLLGGIPHYQVIEQLRKSFCVFYPQPKRCETFGLVYAEANAVGTPVLAHDIGAAKEVLSDASQLVNGHDARSVVQKIIEWRLHRPILKAKENFRLNNVIKEWITLLNKTR